VVALNEGGIGRRARQAITRNGAYILSSRVKFKVMRNPIFLKNRISLTISILLSAGLVIME